MGDPDMEIKARATAKRLRVRRRADTEATATGDAELISDSARRNLPPGAKPSRFYRDVEVRGRASGRLL
jgi:hypothetical protein